MNDPSTTKGLKAERKILLSWAKRIHKGGVEKNNHPHGERRKLLHILLSIAAHPKRITFNPDLVKAALELYSYNDRLAALYLQDITSCDYPEEIAKVRAKKKC